MYYEERFKPSKNIEYGAMAVTNIVPEDLISCAPSNEARLPAYTNYIIGHNVDYDWKALGKPDVKRICTLALSRHVLPDLDSHTQSAMLYYFLGIEAREMLINSHSASH